MKRRSYPIAVLIAYAFMLLGAYALSYAQESARPVEVNGDQVEYFPKEKKIVGSGNISIDYGDVKLSCDRITVYTDTKDAYAEGGVILRTSTGDIKGEKIKYNFNTKKGEILKIRIKAGEWYGGGERAELIPDGSVKITNGYMTSCDLEEPHYKISSKNVTIYPENKIVAKNVVFKIGKVPVAYLPRYDYSMDTEWPTFNLVPGKKKKWGLFLLTSYRYEMNEGNKFTIRLDEREHWGLGEGLDYRYTFGDLGHGLLRTYYTHQRDRDRGETIKAEEERYRVQVRHRLDMNEDLTALLEYHRLRDEDVTKDFFYREEYDREPSPESYLYLLEKKPEYALSFLARKRVNRFQNVVERLPEFRFDLKDQGIFEMPLYFKTDTTVTNLNSKTANSDVDGDVIRFDTYNRLSGPLRVFNFLSITPFAGTRETFYNKDVNGDEDEIRTAFYSGIDVSTKFFKTSGASGRFLGVDFNKLQHIITPTIEYEYIHEPSTVPGGLQQFDDIDAIDRRSVFGLGLENRLKTKRMIDNKLRTVDLGYFLLTGDYLYRPENGSRFSNVKGDLEFSPYSWLRMESDTQYDPDTRDFQSWNLDLYMENGEEWRLGFGSRYWQDTEHELTSELWYKLNNEWSFRLFGRYDLKEIESNGHKIINRFSNKELTVVKDLHCWVAEVSLEINRDGGMTAWFVMKLKATPRVPFDFKDYYPFPKQ